MSGCISTGLIPDCLEAQESDWKISYIVPRSPYVTYQYQGEQLNTVLGGTSYTLEPYYGTNRTRSYILKIRQQWSYGAFTDSNPNGTTFWKREAVFYSSPIQGEILGVRLQSNNITNNTITIYSSFRWFGLGRVDVRRINSSGVTGIAAAVGINANSFGDYVRNSNTHTNDIDPTGSAKDVNTFGVLSGNFQAVQNASGALGGYCRVRTDTCSIEAILPAVANQPPDGYTLTIKNCNNNVIFTRSSSLQPIVNMYPCDYNQDDEQTLIITGEERRRLIASPYVGLIANETIALDGTLGIRAELTGWPIDQYLGTRITVLELSSPFCCAKPPKICWECERQKELCPEGTCLKCSIEGGQICCYGENGEVLKIISNKDETADC